MSRPERHDELEARIRATLLRRAADIEPSPPDWHDLVHRAGGVVVPLRPSDAAAPPAHRRARRRFPWRPPLPSLSLRTTFATAAALAIVVGAAVVAGNRSGDGGGTGPADGGGDDGSSGHVALDAADSPIIPAPGAVEFRPDLATAIPTDLPLTVEQRRDPVSLAQASLAEVGLYDNGYELRANEFRGEHDEPVEEAVAGTVWWSLRDNLDNPLFQGAVFLRRASVDGDQDAWEVVGVSTSGGMMGISGVRRTDGQLFFTVGDYIGPTSTRVLVDGVEHHDGALTRNTKGFAIDDPAPDRPVTIEVVHLEAGRPVAVVAMAVDTEDAARIVLEAERQAEVTGSAGGVVTASTAPAPPTVP